MTASWSAVVVNYEAGRRLADCVRSIVADSTAGGTPEVVVVDNGSTDGSVDALAASAPGVPVVRPGANVGYARAANLGIAATSGPVVAVCNPDVEVRPGTAAALLARFAAEPDLAALGPMVRNPDGSVYPSARSVPAVRDALGHGVLAPFAPGNRFTRRYRQLDADPARSRDVDWVSGAAVWLRRAAVEAVGGWDERYFMYVEDVDLCWRLRRAGWRVAYEPGGEVVHAQGASTARHPYRMIVEHHRSLARFAATRWRGRRRVLLVPAAAFLAVRAVAIMGAHAVRSWRARSPVNRTSG